MKISPYNIAKSAVTTSKSSKRVVFFFVGGTAGTRYYILHASPVYITHTHIYMYCAVLYCTVPYRTVLYVFSICLVYV